MSQAKPRGIRQTMSDLHIWTGLLAGWLLYAMFLTGSVSYFRQEISAWMRPELRAEQPEDGAAAAQRLIDALLSEHAPGAVLLGIDMPTPRNPAASAFWRNGDGGFGSGIFDPASGKTLTARDTRGGDFFYRFHFNLHYVPVLWGRWIAGLCAMFMLVAIVSGIITHKKIFTDFFTFRWGKGQRSWLDGHAALSVLGLPFHLMITYSGLVTLMVLYMPWGMQALPSAEAREAVNNELRLFLQPMEKAGEAAPLVPVGELIAQAEARWGEGGIGHIQINNPGDANARIALGRQQAQRVATTPQYLLFDGATGRLLQVKDRAGPAATTQGVIYGLHMGRFADLATRWLYFLLSLAGTAMVGSGLVLWVVKRRAKLADPARPHFGIRLVERLNIAAIAGFPLAMAAFLWGNRLLPVGLTGRADWEIHLMFIVWGLALGYTLLRPLKRAWIELLCATAIALALLPVLNLLTSARGLPASLAAGDWTMAGFDLGALALAALAAEIARRIARHRPRVAAGRTARRRLPAGQVT